MEIDVGGRPIQVEEIVGWVRDMAREVVHDALEVINKALKKKKKLVSLLFRSC